MCHGLAYIVHHFLNYLVYIIALLVSCCIMEWVTFSFVVQLASYSTKLIVYCVPLQWLHCTSWWCHIVYCADNILYHDGVATLCPMPWSHGITCVVYHDDGYIVYQCGIYTAYNGITCVVYHGVSYIVNQCGIYIAYRDIACMVNYGVGYVVNQCGIYTAYRGIACILNHGGCCIVYQCSSYALLTVILLIS